jgi:hypothetical protein
MKAALGSFVILPLVLAALVTSRSALRTFPTLAAAVAGEVLGLFLYAGYKHERVAAILSGKASSSVGYVGPDAPRNQIEAFLSLCVVGIALGLLVLAVRWIYFRLRSAAD